MDDKLIKKLQDLFEHTPVATRDLVVGYIERITDQHREALTAAEAEVRRGLQAASVAINILSMLSTNEQRQEMHEALLHALPDIIAANVITHGTKVLDGLPKCPPTPAELFLLSAFQHVILGEAYDDLQRRVEEHVMENMMRNAPKA